MPQWTRICRHCRTSFTQPAGTGRPFEHCGPVCARKAKTNRDRKFYHARSGTPVDIACAGCGCVFQHVHANTGGRRPTVCSEPCRESYLKAYRAARWRARVAARTQPTPSGDPCPLPT